MRPFKLGEVPPYFAFFKVGEERAIFFQRLKLKKVITWGKRVCFSLVNNLKCRFTCSKVFEVLIENLNFDLLEANNLEICCRNHASNPAVAEKFRKFLVKTIVIYSTSTINFRNLWATADG